MFIDENFIKEHFLNEIKCIMQERRNYANEKDFWNAHMRRAKKTGNMERMSQTELLKVIRK